MSTATAHGSAVEATNGNGHVSFSELVRAHHEWDANGGHAAAEDVERRYRTVLSGFEAGAGESPRASPSPVGSASSAA